MEKIFSNGSILLHLHAVDIVHRADEEAVLLTLITRAVEVLAVERVLDIIIEHLRFTVEGTVTLTHLSTAAGGAEKHKYRHKCQSYYRRLSHCLDPFEWVTVLSTTVTSKA